jgi:hypothetical protein
MGKGRGNFAYLCAAPRGNTVLVELDCPHMTDQQIKRGAPPASVLVALLTDASAAALRAASARIPSKCEIISRDVLPKIGTESVPRDWRPPHSLPRGALPAGNVVYQNALTNAELVADFKALGSPEASDLPVKRVVVTSGGHEGETRRKVELRASSAEPTIWRAEMKRLYRKARHQRSSARKVADAILEKQRTALAARKASMPDIVAP